MKKAVLKNFAIFTGKLQACNFIKNTLQQRCFPSEYCEIFKNSYFEEHLPGEQLLILLSSSDNLFLLTGYEQLRYYQFVFH